MHSIKIITCCLGSWPSTLVSVVYASCTVCYCQLFHFIRMGDYTRNANVALYIYIGSIATAQQER